MLYDRSSLTVYFFKKKLFTYLAISGLSGDIGDPPWGMWDFCCDAWTL